MVSMGIREESVLTFFVGSGLFTSSFLSLTYENDPLILYQ